MSESRVGVPGGWLWLWLWLVGGEGDGGVLCGEGVGCFGGGDGVVDHAGVSCEGVGEGSAPCGGECDGGVGEGACVGVCECVVWVGCSGVGGGEWGCVVGEGVVVFGGGEGEGDGGVEDGGVECLGGCGGVEDGGDVGEEEGGVGLDVQSCSVCSDCACDVFDEGCGGGCGCAWGSVFHEGGAVSGGDPEVAFAFRDHWVAGGVGDFYACS